jgi:thiamine pyrophosphokinase
MIVRSHTGMIVVGAGDVSAEDLALIRALGHPVVAADGGARRCLDAGIMPEAVIGDLDSIGGTLAGLPPDRLHRLDEQETTDFDKCLRSVAAPLVHAFGVTGPRLDHTLAVCTTLVQRAEVRAVVVGEVDLLFHAPPRLALDLEPGSRLSLFPMAGSPGAPRGCAGPSTGSISRRRGGSGPRTRSPGRCGSLRRAGDDRDHAAGGAGTRVGGACRLIARSRRMT